MNVAHLIEILSDQDPKAEVRMAVNPNWPIAHAVAGVADPTDWTDNDPAPVVWLVDGGQVVDYPYAPTEAFEHVQD
jgi:hypothetical protein